METYILQAVCFMALFIAVYFLVLRNETFFTYNRLYLILTPLIALLLPLFKITAFQTAIPVERFTTLLPEIFLGSATEGPSEIPPTGASVYVINWWFIYVTGALLSMAYLALKFYKLSRFITHSPGDKIITMPGSSEAFTFLNYIFIGDRIDTLSRKRILAHENIHIQKKHSLDLLYFELLRVVLWFNPLVYLYQKEIALLHEYEADYLATRKQSKKQYYTALLNATFGTQQLSFTNTFFNQSFIKKRIIMLQKSKSKKIALTKYALIIPMILGMLFYVSCSEDNGNQDKSQASLENQIADLKFALEEKENLSDDELKRLSELITASNQKRTDNSLKSLRLPYTIEYDSLPSVPFAVIDRVPVYPGCESLTSNEERKVCMSEMIAQFVNSQFDIKMANGLGLSGTTKIYTSFMIDKNGDITNVQARAPHPALQEEVFRIVKQLPKMKPGKQGGKPVGVLYSLPVTFKIAE